MRLIDADYLKNLLFERLIHTDFGETAIPIEEIDNAPTVDITHAVKVTSDDIKKLDNTDSIDFKTCGNCHHLIFKDYKHCEGFCEKLRISRRFNYPCVHEEDMS